MLFRLTYAYRVGMLTPSMAAASVASTYRRLSSSIGFSRFIWINSINIDEYIGRTLMFATSIKRHAGGGEHEKNPHLARARARRGAGRGCTGSPEPAGAAQGEARARRARGR